MTAGSWQRNGKDKNQGGSSCAGKPMCAPCNLHAQNSSLPTCEGVPVIHSQSAAGKYCPGAMQGLAGSARQLRAPLQVQAAGRNRASCSLIRPAHWGGAHFSPALWSAHPFCCSTLRQSQPCGLKDKAASYGSCTSCRDAALGRAVAQYVVPQVIKFTVRSHTN